MSGLAEVQEAVRRLGPRERAEFRVWWAERDAEAWDEEMTADAAAGHLDELAAAALREHRLGRTRPTPDVQSKADEAAA